MKKFLYLFAFLIISFFSLPARANDDKITLSITPPLIKNNANPGQVWQSMIKVMNNNTEDINIYVQVSDFRGGKENGKIEFLSKPQDTVASTSIFLSDWITIDKGPITIPAAKSIEIPFVVEVPEDASPGGHYAAFLIGTKPPEGAQSGSVIKISSLLASLLFMTVNGDIQEKARIVDFSSDKTFYFQPKVNFKIRMENMGNVDVQPRGEIKIYDMFGKEKGTIPINHDSEFGNILPDTAREWNFPWSKGKSILDMGRYKAHLVVTYGTHEIQTEDYVYFFWIVYPKIVGGVLLAIILLFLFISFWIKRSIKKAVNETNKMIGTMAPIQSAPLSPVNKSNPIPVQGTHVLDLSDRGKKKKNKISWTTLKIFFAIVLFLLFSIAGVFYYFSKPENTKSNSPELAKVSDKNEPIQEERIVQEPVEAQAVPETVATSTETEETQAETGTSTPADIKSKPNVAILNGCGKRGVAADVDQFLTDKGYEISRLGNADNFNYYNTVIKYSAGFNSDAEELSQLFKGQAEIQESSAIDDDIVVIIGSNLEI